jgi:transcriptional regulator with XRE-family HTH domain
MKIRELASKAHTSASQLENYLYGRSEPSVWVVVRLAEVLGVTVNYLLGLEEPYKEEYLTERRLRLSLLEKLVKYEGVIGDTP